MFNSNLKYCRNCSYFSYYANKSLCNHPLNIKVVLNSFSTRHIRIHKLIALEMRKENSLCGIDAKLYKEKQ